jgi:hypothetical protein
MNTPQLNPIQGEASIEALADRPSQEVTLFASGVLKLSIILEFRSSRGTGFAPSYKVAERGVLVLATSRLIEAIREYNIRRSSSTATLVEGFAEPGLRVKRDPSKPGMDGLTAFHYSED